MLLEAENGEYGRRSGPWETPRWKPRTPRPAVRSVTLSFLAGSLALSPRSLPAQSASALLAAGDSLTSALDPRAALTRYQAALAREPALYEALWKAGRAVVDVAKQIEGSDARSRARRDSLYHVAWAYAGRAVAADSTEAEGHFVLALALGRLARTKGGRDRVRLGGIIYREAARALALRPDHDGAHHVLGAWHAEAKRLSAPERFLARALLGARFLSIASRDSAVAHLRRAVELNPLDVYHRLELAEIYIDLRRYDDARQQLLSIPDLPDGDVLDPLYRRRAVQLLEAIKNRTRP